MLADKIVDVWEEFSLNWVVRRRDWEITKLIVVWETLYPGVAAESPLEGV